MAKKLIFLDIDGTLISGLAKPSPLVERAIRQARAGGYLVFLSTGRNMPIIVPDILNIGFDGIIASAGAYIEVRGETLLDSLLSEDVVQECLSVLHQNGLYCRLETREGIYMDLEMEALLRSAAPDPRNSELIRMQQEMDSELSIRPYGAYLCQGAYKLSFTVTDPKGVGVAQKVLGDRFDFVVYPWRESSSFLNGEIIPKEVDKGKAIAIVCRHVGADLSDTIAFGDSMNDASMLIQAGTAVAMGNACDELKALADVVCEDVAHDGVYHELHRRGIC